MEKNKWIASLLFGLFVWGLVVFLALSFGAVHHADWDLIVHVRLPRVILASGVGMGLAVAGAALQALFANSLCEPYTLGISSGAALGAVVGTSLGLQWMFAGITGTAFAGAVLFAGILYFFSIRPGSNHIRLLLTGVMLGFFGSSLVALWVALSDSNGLQSTMIWLFGDLSRARLQGAFLSFLSLLVLVILIWRQWRELDALLLGEEGALTLGVDMISIRQKMIILTSLLVGLCVSAAGMIGFVGLVVPHFARRFVGSLHLVLIPFCAVWGAIVLTTADGLSRTLVKPYELPVGIVMALIGAPVFLIIMLKKNTIE